MISIHRGRAPKIFRTTRAPIDRLIWKVFGGDDDAEAAYRRSEPLERHLRNAGVRRPLARTFHGKCAFCETRIEAGQGSPDHFRPRNNTLNFRGEHFARHYFWLAFEWTNLHLVCADCRQAKANRFPLRDEAMRAAVPTGPQVAKREINRALAREHPLLLDPCRDDPAEHLYFDQDSAAAVSKTEQGEVSIELYDLNRTQLCAARGRALAELDRELDGLDGPVTRKLAERLLGDDVEYAAIRRQRFAAWARDRDVDDDVPAAWLRPAPETRAIPDPVAMSFSIDAGGDQEPPGASPAGDTYYRQSRKIEKVVLRDFRSIDELVLELPRGTSERAGWAMILGENGTGKSTMLHGIALALSSDDYRAQLVERRNVDPAGYVRRVSEGEGPTTGSVEVYLTGVREPARLEVRRGERRFFGSPATDVFLLVGYGSTRLLPRGRAESSGTRHARVDNLFDPFVPLGDARSWLLERTPEEFKPLAAAFRKLLDLGSDFNLIQNHDAGRIEVSMYHTVVPLEQLSDGYQSVIALTADVMSILHAKWGSMAIAEGVVLLDELGAHLHPKWRMRIIKSLRETFPRVQFIVTTHDPLCLRGLDDGEVIVARRDRRRRVVVRTDLPPVAGLRVDQLLTSEHFGLASTLDPEVERDFEAYYQLLAEDQLDDQQRQRLEQLKQRFDQRHMLGNDRRERLMLEAIDRHLAREAELATAGERQSAKGRLEVQLDNLLAALEV